MDEKIDLKQVAKENAKKATEKKSDDHWTQDFKTTGTGKDGDDSGGTGAQIANTPEFCCHCVEQNCLLQVWFQHRHQPMFLPLFQRGH